MTLILIALALLIVSVSALGVSGFFLVRAIRRRGAPQVRAILVSLAWSVGGLTAATFARILLGIARDAR